jgi:hypothetical protein
MPLSPNRLYSRNEKHTVAYTKRNNNGKFVAGEHDAAETDTRLIIALWSLEHTHIKTLCVT